MQRPTQIIVTASGASNPIPLDYYVNGYALAVVVKTPGSGVGYTVQYSLDSPYNDPAGNKYNVSYNVSGAWFSSDDPVMVNQSASRTSNFAFAPLGVRVFASSGVSAANPITLSIVPMGAL